MGFKLGFVLELSTLATFVGGGEAVVFVVVDVVEGLDGGEGLRGGFAGDDGESGISRREEWDFRGVRAEIGLKISAGFNFRNAPHEHEAAGASVRADEGADPGEQSEVGRGPEGDCLAVSLGPDVDEGERGGVFRVEDGGSGKEELVGG